MLLNFKVKNFRSIKEEVVLDLQATSDKTMQSETVFTRGKVALLKCAAIYGHNASGKSNLLKALAVFRNMVLESLLRSNMPRDLPNEFFKLSAVTENQPSSFAMTFLLDGEVFSYGFAIDKKQVIEEWLRQEKGNKLLFKREHQDIVSNKNYFPEASTSLKGQVGERVLFLSLLASHNQPLSQKIVKFIQKTNVVLSMSKMELLNYSFNKFVSDPGMAAKIKEFIVQADIGVVDIKASKKMVTVKELHNIPDKFKALLFKEDTPIGVQGLKFLHKQYDQNSEELTSKAELDFFAEESDGTQQIFALSALFIDTLAKGNILFIDELEASLHPMFCQYLVMIFNSKKKNPNNAQCIFTTHNLALLSEEFLRRDEIYFINKNHYGATELFSLASISERKGVNFAKRYMEGRYNAVPYISEFENLKVAK